MLLPGLAVLLTALPLAAAGSTTLPTITLTEAEWVKLQASSTIDDFAFIFRRRVLDLFALVNAALAEEQSRGGLNVSHSVKAYGVANECEVNVTALRSNSTAALVAARAAGERLSLDPAMPGNMSGDVYEAVAALEVPLNTETKSFAIIRELYRQFMNSKCAAYAEKPVRFWANYSAVVPAALRLQLSQPRAVVSRNGTRQVVFSFNASISGTGNLTASQPDVSLEQKGTYGCSIETGLGINVEPLLWLTRHWFTNSSYCDRFKGHFLSHSQSLVDGAVAPVAGVAIQTLSGRIIEAVGTSVVIPVQVEGGAGALPSPLCVTGSYCPVAI